MRSCIIEIIGNLIIFLVNNEDGRSNQSEINGFFDILEERFRDVQAFCRSKLLQVYLKLCK